MMMNNIFELILPPITKPIIRQIIMEMRLPIARKKLSGYKKLHLACGNNILDGWANIDLVGNNTVIGWDLRYQLPISAGSIELIFCEHFLEHLTLKQGNLFLIDCLRVLRPGGVLRISTPSLEVVIKEYLSGLTPGLYDSGWQPESPCQMVNEGLRLWGHQFVYDKSELKRCLENAGFKKETEVAWHKSMNPELANLECRPDHGEIIIEAIK
jgi:predicted SAM-dependent methyltransferase